MTDTVGVDPDNPPLKVVGWGRRRSRRRMQAENAMFKAAWERAGQTRALLRAGAARADGGSSGGNADPILDTSGAQPDAMAPIRSARPDVIWPEHPVKQQALARAEEQVVGDATDAVQDAEPTPGQASASRLATPASDEGLREDQLELLKVFLTTDDLYETARQLSLTVAVAAAELENVRLAVDRSPAARADLSATLSEVRGPAPTPPTTPASAEPIPVRSARSATPTKRSEKGGVTARRPEQVN